MKLKIQKIATGRLKCFSNVKTSLKGYSSCSNLKPRTLNRNPDSDLHTLDPEHFVSYKEKMNRKKNSSFIQSHKKEEFLQVAEFAAPGFEPYIPDLHLQLPKYAHDT